jgi:hypothetical protein
MKKSSFLLAAMLAAVIGTGFAPAFTSTAFAQQAAEEKNRTQRSSGIHESHP